MYPHRPLKPPIFLYILLRFITQRHNFGPIPLKSPPVSLYAQIYLPANFLCFPPAAHVNVLLNIGLVVVHKLGVPAGLLLDLDRLVVGLPGWQAYKLPGRKNN